MVLRKQLLHRRLVFPRPFHPLRDLKRLGRVPLVNAECYSRARPGPIVLNTRTNGYIFEEVVLRQPTVREHIDDNIILTHRGAKDTLALRWSTLQVFKGGGKPFQRCMVQAEQRKSNPPCTRIGAVTQFA